QRYETEHPRAHHEYRQCQEQGDDAGEEEAVIVRRASCNVESPRSDDHEEGSDREQAGEAELFTDRRQHQVGITGWHIARVAEAEAGAEHAASRKSPDRLRDLLTAPCAVVP